MVTPTPNWPLLQSTWGTFKRALMGCGLALLIGLVILVMSFASATHPLAAGLNAVEAQLMAPLPATVSAEKTEYYLPYPGILPDSPLYVLKTARDRVKLMTTLDKAKHAEVALLLADKRINAAQVLLDGGKAKLGVTTATKAEKYLAQAGQEAEDMARSGKDVKSLLLTLTKAATKHAEILTAMKERLTPEDQAVIQKSLESTQTLIQTTKQAVMDY